MSTITIEVEEKDISFIKTLLEHLKGVKNITIKQEESPYNADLVKSVQEGRTEYNQGECKTISIDELWK